MKVSAAAFGKLLVCMIVVLAAVRAEAQYDDFNDGNDAGWFRYEPLAPFGAPGSFTFPNGGYRIGAAVSPNPALLGPGRAGSFRLDTPPEFLGAMWRLEGWDDTLDQSFGALIRASSIGLGTLDGYAFTYSTRGSLHMVRIDDDQATILASQAVVLDPTKDYGFDLLAVGAWLRGEVFEAAVGGAVRVGSLEVLDSTYLGAGVAGLYVFSNVPGGGADATFDAFGIGIVPEPTALSLMLLGSLGLGGLAWRNSTGRNMDGRPR